MRAGVCVSRDRTETESTALKILLQGTAVDPTLTLVNHHERLDFVCKWSQFPASGSAIGGTQTCVVTNPTTAAVACTVSIAESAVSSAVFCVDAVEVNGQRVACGANDIIALPPGASACVSISLRLSSSMLPVTSAFFTSSTTTDASSPPAPTSSSAPTSPPEVLGAATVLVAATDLRFDFAGGQTQSIPLLATVEQPQVTVSHPHVDYGVVQHRSVRTLILSNSGLDDLVYLVRYHIHRWLLFQNPIESMLCIAVRGRFHCLLLRCVCYKSLRRLWVNLPLCTGCAFQLTVTI